MSLGRLFARIVIGQLRVEALERCADGSQRVCELKPNVIVESDLRVDEVFH